ncbi:hypothetical protein CBS101457_003333 [Exobasidium rhododendri]|nr:hypothetical protein CBS101457_003333 [Exobasidium rhododendri]
MPILERTPPRKRIQPAEDSVGIPSSPSQFRIAPSPRLQTTYDADNYVFPSLEALAVPVREKNAAMNTKRTSASFSVSPYPKSPSNKELNSGSRADSSYKSGRTVGGPAGRNGPTLTMNAANLYPAIGARDSVSPRIGLRSPLSIAKQVRSADDTLRLESPSTSKKGLDHAQLYPDLPPHAPVDEVLVGSRSKRESSTILPNTNTFEAQMERALASGANPFQDRKRNQMRDESRLQGGDELNDTIEAPHVPSPTLLRSPLLSSSAISSTCSSPQIHTVNGVIRPTTSTKSASARPTTPSPTPLSPLPRGKAPAGLARAASPSRDDVLRLQLQLKEEKAKLQEAKNGWERIVKELRQRKKESDIQVVHIKDLKGKVAEWKEKAKRAEAVQSIPSAHAWELVRARLKDAVARAEESMERDAEAIIGRNEVSYMDARRAEGELDLRVSHLELEEMQSRLREANDQIKSLESDLQLEKASAEDVRVQYSALVSQESLVMEALKETQSKYSLLQGELKDMTKKLAEERSTLQRWKQAHTSSPNRMALLAKTRMNCPVGESRRRDVRLTPGRVVRTAETGRQSPRQKITATTSRAKSSLDAALHLAPAATAVSNEGAFDEENVEDAGEEFAETRETVIAANHTAAMIVKEVSKEPFLDTPVEQEGDGRGKLEQPLLKRKAGILNRAKKMAGVTSAKPEGNSKMEGEEVKRKNDTLADVQKTPLVPAKKRQARADLVVEAEDEEDKEDEDARDTDTEATPIVPTKRFTATTKNTTKTKKQPKSTEDEMTVSKTPLVRKKRSLAESVYYQDEKAAAAGVASGSKTGKGKQVSAGTVTTVVEKKKKRRLLKPNSNVANNFMNCNGDTSGDLNPGLNLPLQLSPIKGDPLSSSSNKKSAIGSKSATAASRVFG